MQMPNMRMSKVDVDDVLRYIGSESNRVQMQKARERRANRGRASAVADAPASHDQHGGGQHGGDQHGGDQHGGQHSDAVAIMNAWVRQAHPDAPVNAGYMMLINVGAEDLTLVKLESPSFDEVELHEMAMADGMMKMRELTEVVIPAGGQARFEPSGKHLMLKGPKQHLTEGQSVELTLIFQSGKRQTVSVRVADK